MEASKSANVFYLSPKSTKSKIVFEDNTFHIYSHIDTKPNGKSIKPILLPSPAMVELVDLLPFLQHKMKEIKEMVDPEDRDYFITTINTSGIYQAKLSVSTYKAAPFIWLKLYFPVEDASNPSQEKMCVCHGGSIFNDVDPIALLNYVKAQIKS